MLEVWSLVVRAAPLDIGLANQLLQQVIGVENGALVAASDDGARFRIEIDEVLQSRIRQVQPEVHNGPKLPPREIQAHIRSGLSAEEVAQLTGAAVEHEFAKAQHACGEPTIRAGKGKVATR